MIECEQSILGVRIRLQLERFEDGWGWRGWEESVADAWRPLPAPAPENRRRRFRTPQSAQQFYYLLAEFISETATEYVSARCVVPRRI